MSAHVIARVGRERFAFRVIDVEEVMDSPELIHVPNAPSGLLGQFLHRDRTVGAYDSGWMFDLARGHGEPKAVTALVLRVSDDRIGLLVDDVEDLTVIEPEQVRAVPAGTDPGGLLRGVCLPAVEAGFRRETRDASFRRETRDASLICLVNAVSVISRGASVVAPALTTQGAA